MTSAEDLNLLKAIAGYTNEEIAFTLGCSKTQITNAINYPKRYPSKFQEIHSFLWRESRKNTKAIALVEKLKESEVISQIA